MDQLEKPKRKSLRRRGRRDKMVEVSDFGVDRDGVEWTMIDGSFYLLRRRGGRCPTLVRDTWALSRLQAFWGLRRISTGELLARIEEPQKNF